MTTQILIHVLPHEIDQLERILIQLKRSSKHLPSGYSFITNVVLNINLNDWANSTIPKKFFIDKFYQLEQLTKTWSKTEFYVSENNEVLGCVDHRRQVFNTTKADNVLVLDTDVFFSDSLLYHIVNGASLVKEITPLYIITPQIHKMWDNSWDELVNEKFINEPISSFKDVDAFTTADCLGEVNIKNIENFKFGGGWGTLISLPLLKMINIPESLGPYGLEDTFLMTCSSILKRKGINIMQFILENELLVEDNKFRFNPYKEYMSIIDRREEFKIIAHNNFEKELIKFGNSL